MTIRLTCPNCGAARQRSLIRKVGAKVLCLACGARAVYVGESFVVKEGWAWEVKQPPPDMEIHYKCVVCNRRLLGRLLYEPEIKSKGLNKNGLYPVYHTSKGHVCPGYDMEMVSMAMRRVPCRPRGKRKAQ